MAEWRVKVGIRVFAWIFKAFGRVATIHLGNLGSFNMHVIGSVVPLVLAPVLM